MIIGAISWYCLGCMDNRGGISCSVRTFNLYCSFAFFFLSFSFLKRTRATVLLPPQQCSSSSSSSLQSCLQPRFVSAIALCPFRHCRPVESCLLCHCCCRRKTIVPNRCVSTVATYARTKPPTTTRNCCHTLRLTPLPPPPLQPPPLVVTIVRLVRHAPRFSLSIGDS